jgi:inositol transporter-like SP family MFS transporter
VIGFAIPVVMGLRYETFVAMVVFFIFGAMFAGEGLFKVISQELMPTMVRSTSQGVTIAVCRFAAAGFAFLTPTLLVDDARPLFMAMLIFSIVTALVVCVWIPRLPRTGLPAPQLRRASPDQTTTRRPGAART